MTFICQRDPAELIDSLQTVLPGLDLGRLQHKVKTEHSGHHSVGHFRFYMPEVLSPQILVLVNSQEDPQRKRLLLMFYGNRQIFTHIQSVLEQKCNVMSQPISLTTGEMKSALNYAQLSGLDASVEIWFGKLNTQGKLGSIIINVGDAELKKLKASSKKKSVHTADLILNSVIEESKINLNELQLIKVKCALFTLTSDGKVNFSEYMSLKEDGNNSIWFYIATLINSV